VPVVEEVEADQEAEELVFQKKFRLLVVPYLVLLL
jgi:hypothetical protein